MNIESTISELHRLFHLYEYAPMVKKYERMLTREVKNNPSNVRAVCLLAMVKRELRKSIFTSLKCLESCYNAFKDSLCDYDFCLLATNLSYFYLEECSKESKAKKLLNAAIIRNSPFAETYYAMALVYYNEKQFKSALILFKKANQICSLFRYRFNYAVCLFKCNYVEESINIFKELSIDFGTHEYKAKAYFTLAVLYSSIGKKNDSKKIVMDLLKIDYYNSLNIEHDDLADLMFSVDEFQHCIELYDKQRLYETADWLGQYFYCQKKIDCTDNAFKKLTDLIDTINNEINDSNIEDFKGDSDRFNDYINLQNERRDSIKAAYEKVFRDDIKPPTILNTDLIYICYYIDCPRHKFSEI